jgi:hemerythrin-like domain-containing protein
MDLLQNPFYILNASPRDNRRRIMELADERSLLLDSNECMEARSDLTNPRKRLSAEIAWLPGIGPKRAGELLSLIESSPTELLGIDSLSSIARANLLSAGLARLDDHNSDDIVEWILNIAWAFEDLDPDELSVIINEERVVSGFPEASDTSSVEAEIQERRRHYRQTIKAALDNLSPKELVKAVTVAVESATDDGEEHGPILIADLVDSYEVEAQGFLDTEEKNISALVAKLRAVVDSEHPDAVLSPLVKQLIQVVKNWDAVAQPIQVSAKSRGLDHDASHRVANLVRSLAIHMFNEHGKLDFSQQLTNMLQEVFAEVGEVAERTAEDADALAEIAEEQIRYVEGLKTKAEDWRREITYEAEVGAIFKDKLCISPEGIEWKGRRWDLDSITRVRWGGTKHSVNGIPTGTTYSIVFGNSSNYTSIELKKEATYSNFIDRLWKAVGVRLLTEYLHGLRDGKKYRFGSTIMSDHGMELERKKFFGSNERIFCRWSELVVWNGAGVFCIGKKDDKKLAAAFSYQEEDNIHVLEAVIRMFWKQGGDRLSSLLGDHRTVRL